MKTEEQILIDAVGVENAGVDFNWDQVMAMMKIYHKQFQDNQVFTEWQMKEFAGLCLNHYKQWGAARTLDELMNEYYKILKP